MYKITVPADYLNKTECLNIKFTNKQSKHLFRTLIALNLGSDFIFETETVKEHDAFLDELAHYGLNYRTDLN